MQEFLDRRKMTEFGPKTLFDTGIGDEGGTAIKLPGVRTGDMSLRAFKPEIRVSCVRFSPTGQHFVIKERCFVTIFILIIMSFKNFKIV